MDYKGIDYSGGTSNIDLETGIRYGIIHQNEILQSWSDESEPVYNDPFCPECGQVLTDARFFDEDSEDEDLEWADKDWCCETCKKSFWSYDVFPDSADRFEYKDDGYDAVQGSDDCDVWVTMSPYYTYAQFCSPCAPGAGYLGNTLKKKQEETLEEYESRAISEGWAKVYCFGDDWFEGGKAPYPVLEVKHEL